MSAARARRPLVGVTSLLAVALAATLALAAPGATSAGATSAGASAGETPAPAPAFDPRVGAAPAASDAVARLRGSKPNIILITTDDEAVSDMQWMPKTIDALARNGVSFTRALSPHPLCCPARAAILTGQYAQNNGVKSNQAPFNFVALDTKTTLPVWMHRAGYRTAFTGKYLNGYGTKGKPQPGWDYWDATMVNPYSYVGYQMFQNGDPKYYGKLNNVDYINRRLLGLVDDWAPSSQPFFIWASHVAPHGRLDKIKNIPSTAKALPPTRFKDLFTNVDSPSLRDPGYLDPDTSDQNSLVNKKLRPSRAKVNEVFRSRIRSLQAVDQGVANLIALLRRKGELDNTYILFTSDNGFLVGEHHLITKNVPYRQSLRVPLFVRGPGLPAGEVRSQRALMIDLAPTIADLAGATPMIRVDGTSLLPTLVDDAPLRDTVLIQAGPQTPIDLPFGWWWRGVTTDRYTYARFFSEKLEELYDQQVDPSETVNLADDPRYAEILAELRQRTADLVTCAGLAQCSRSYPPLPEPLPGPDVPTDTPTDPAPDPVTP
ncbi:sulfatase [Nocardioides sp.]|uniref:sulfatase family protein n=1 Tax=Nocardioides sp. TaxID=35761 RepID=UPI00351269CE